MTPNLQLIFNIANLICYAIAGIGAIVIFFKRPKNLAEEMRDCINIAISELRKEFKEEIKSCKTSHEFACSEKHREVSKAYTELYNLDRKRRDDLGEKLDAIRGDLSHYQQAIVTQLADHNARINNLEKK